MSSTARAIGIPREKLRSIAKAAGIKFPGGNYTPDACRSRAAWIESRRRLTDEQIRAIRADQRSQRVIAQELGVSPSAVCRARRRTSWKILD